jgi:hypothetical protein
VCSFVASHRHHERALRTRANLPDFAEYGEQHALNDVVDIPERHSVAAGDLSNDVTMMHEQDTLSLLATY